MESEHFKDAELRCRGTDCGLTPDGERTGQPCGLNLCQQELLDALEVFRASAKAVWESAQTAPFPGVVVDSAYRCRIHNSAVGGKPDSQHLQGIAADIRVPSMIAAHLEQIAREIPAIRGIGRADHQEYVHIDTRPTEATWCYDAAGSTVPYFPAVLA